MTSPAVDEYGYILHPIDNIDEWGRFFNNGWSEDGRFRIGVYLEYIVNEAVGMMDAMASTPWRVLADGVLCQDGVLVAAGKVFTEYTFIEDLGVERWIGSIVTLIENMSVAEFSMLATMQREFVEYVYAGMSKWLDELGRTVYPGGITEYGRFWGEGGDWASTEVGDRIVQFCGDGETLEKFVSRSLLETLQHYHGWPLRYIDGRVFADSITLADIGLFTNFKQLVEALGLADEELLWDISKYVEEYVGIVDSVSKGFIHSDFVERIEMYDSMIAGKVLEFIEALLMSDTSVAVDVVHEWIEYVRTADGVLKDVVKSDLEELLGILDNLIFGGAHYKVFEEVMGLTDEIEKYVDVYLDEVLGLLDGRDVQAVLVDLVEAIGLSDIISLITKNYVLFTESMGLADDMAANIVAGIAERVLLVDVLSKGLQVVDLVETMGALVDEVSSRMPIVGKVEGVGLADAIDERDVSILVRELLTVLDIRNAGVDRTVVDAVEIADSFGRRFRNRVRRMSGTMSRMKFGTFIKRKVQNTMKQRYKSSTFWEGDEDE